MKEPKPKILLLDDEQLILNGIQRMLRIHGYQTLAATKPEEAIDIMKKQNIGVLVCDQRMPEMSGLEFMQYVKEYFPHIVRILLTGYADINSTITAINKGLIFRYLTKPWKDHELIEAIADADRYRTEQIEKDRIVNNFHLEKEKWEESYQSLYQTLEGERRKNSTKQGEKKRLQIHCLGRFSIAWENSQPVKWRTEKTKEIFAYLLENESRHLTKEILLDALWPDDDYDKSLRQLYNGIYHIRKALDDYKIDRDIVCIENKYNMLLRNVDHDVRKFYELEKIGDMAALEEMDALYVGDYLETEDYPWAFTQREKLRSLYQQSMLKISELYIDRKEIYKAENILKKIYIKNPYEEIITERLLELYKQTGQKSKALSHYTKYTKLLLDDLNIRPGNHINRLLHFVKE